MELENELLEMIVKLDLSQTERHIKLLIYVMN